MDVSFGIVCQFLLQLQLAQVFLTKGCNYFYFMNKYCKHMSCCFYTIRTCKCRVYMYVILFVNLSYCYFFQYTYITNVYRCKSVINSCACVYFCFKWFLLIVILNTSTLYNHHLRHYQNHF